MWRAARQKNSEKTVQSCHGWWNMRRVFCPGGTPFERLHGKKPSQEFVPFGEQARARPISPETLNRMNPRYKFGVWLGVRNNSAECFVGTTERVFRAREVRRSEQQDRWDKEAINNVIGVPWRIVDGKWTGPTIQIDPLPPPPVTFEGARVQRERITRACVGAFGTTAGCPGCNAIRSGKRAQAHSDPCFVRIEERLTMTPEGTERLDRRSEVLNEALAREVERNVRRREEAGRFDKEACNESRDSGCEQWQITVGKQPCSGRRVKNGCRGRRERRIIHKFDRT